MTLLSLVLAQGHIYGATSEDQAHYMEVIICTAHLQAIV